MSRFSITYQNRGYPDIDELYVEVPDAPHVPCPGDVVMFNDDKSVWIVHDTLWFVYDLHSARVAARRSKNPASADTIDPAHYPQQHVVAVMKKPNLKKRRKR